MLDELAKVRNLTWGVDSAIAIPSGTDDLLGSGKLGLGPTGVALIQSDPWTFLVQTESTYDWQTEQWAVPINASIFKIVVIGSQKVQLQVGGRYWAESPRGGPDDFGNTLKITFLFPR